MKKTAVIFLGCLALRSVAQDFSFINTNQSLLTLNPSFAGSNGGARDQFSFRGQGHNQTSGNLTFHNTFDTRLEKINAGIAVSVMHKDLQSGITALKAAAVTYAQYIKLGKDLTFVPSLQVAYGEKRIASYIVPEGSFFQWRLPQPVISTKNYISINPGLLFNYKKNLYLGASFFDLNQGGRFVSKYHSALNVTIHSSYTFHRSERSLLQVSARLRKGEFFTHLYGSVNGIFFNRLIAGAGFNTLLAPELNVGYRGDAFSIVLGYDVLNPESSRWRVSAWELHASFNLRKKEFRHALANFEAQ